MVKRFLAAAAALAIFGGASAQLQAQTQSGWDVVAPDYLGGGQAAITCPLDGEQNVMCFAVVCSADKDLHFAYIGNGSGVSDDRYTIRFTIDGKSVPDIRFDRTMSRSSGLDYFRAQLMPMARGAFIDALSQGDAGTFLFVDPRFSPGELSLAGSKAAISKVVEGCRR